MRSPTREDRAVTVESSWKRSFFSCFFSVPRAIKIPYSLALKRKKRPKAYTVNTKHPTAVTPRRRTAIFLVSPPSGRKSCTVGPKYIREKEVTRRTDKIRRSLINNTVLLYFDEAFYKFYSLSSSPPSSLKISRSSSMNSRRVPVLFTSW